MMDDPVDFSAFGTAFLQTLLSPTLLRAQIIAAVPPITSIDTPLQGEATFHPGDPDALMIGEGAFGADAVDFSIQVRMGLSLSFNGMALPAFAITFTMRMQFRTYAPLVLLADIAPLAERDVAVIWQVSELQRIEAMLITAGALAVLQSVVVAMLGADKVVSGAVGCVELLVAGKVREAINAKIAGSLPSRIVDLEALLLEKASADRKPAGGGALALDPGGMLVPRDTTAIVTIAPRGTCDVGLLLREGEAIKLLLYAQMGFAPPLIFPGAALAWRFGLVGGDLDDDSGAEDVTSAWSGICTRIAVPQAGSLRQETFYKAAVDGRYVLRLSNPVTSGAAVAVTIQQTRQNDPGIIAASRRIDFASFGRNFIAIGLSSAFFREQLGPKLATPISQKWSNEAVGDVEVAAAIKLGTISDVPSDAPARRALRRVEIAATVDLLRMRGKTRERLVRAPVKAALMLAIETTTAPLKLHVKLAKLDSLSIDVAKVTAIDNLVKDLATFLLGAFQDRVSGLLSTSVDTLLGGAGFDVAPISIAEAAAGVAQAAQPAAAAGRPPPRGDIQVADKVQGGASIGYPIPLAKGERIALVAKVNPEQPPQATIPSVSLAICDAQNGMLQQKDVAFDVGQTKPQSLSFAFTAPEDAQYIAKIRAHSVDQEDWKTIQFALSIKRSPSGKPTSVIAETVEGTRAATRETRGR